MRFNSSGCEVHNCHNACEFSRELPPRPALYYTPCEALIALAM